MLIAIDHGNKQVKTVHRTFTSGLAESDTPPAFGDDVIKYGGKYYTPAAQRFTYMRDKTENENFFILTLFAVAMEVEATNSYSNDILDVQLAVGVPPAHWGTQHETFRNYFLNRDIVEFEYRDKPYAIYINEVCCFPQAYAAATPLIRQLVELPKSYVIDIGGFTADYMLMQRGQAERSVSDSLENGVILLYNRVRSRVNADFDLLLDEADIDAILKGEPTGYDEAVIALVNTEAQMFINDLLGKLRERQIDLRNGKTVFVGGGSILLRKQIEASGKIGRALFVNDISANAVGYECLYRASKAGR